MFTHTHNKNSTRSGRPVETFQIHHFEFFFPFKPDLHVPVSQRGAWVRLSFKVIRQINNAHVKTLIIWSACLTFIFVQYENSETCLSCLICHSQHHVWAASSRCHHYYFISWLSEVSEHGDVFRFNLKPKDIQFMITNDRKSSKLSHLRRERVQTFVYTSMFTFVLCSGPLGTRHGYSSLTTTFKGSISLFFLRYQPPKKSNVWALLATVMYLRKIHCVRWWNTQPNRRSYCTEMNGG